MKRQTFQFKKSGLSIRVSDEGFSLWSKDKIWIVDASLIDSDYEIVLRNGYTTARKNGGCIIFTLKKEVSGKRKVNS